MGSQDSLNSKQLLKDNALMGVWVTSSKTKGLNIPLNVYGLKMQEGNRFGNVSSGFLPNSKCLKNFSTCDQTQLQKFMNDPETAKVIMQIQAARWWLCLRGRVSWDPLQAGRAPSGGLSALWSHLGLSLGQWTVGLHVNSGFCESESARLLDRR